MRSRLRRHALLGAVVLLSGLSNIASAQDVSELAKRIKKEKDRVELTTFRELAAIGDEPALAALTASVPLLKKLPTLQAAYTAIGDFSEAQGDLHTEARLFITREVFRAKNRDAKPLAMANLIRFGDDALPGVEKALTDHVDPTCRQLACGVLLPRLAATPTATSLALILENADPASTTARAFIGLPAEFANEVSGLSPRSALAWSLTHFVDEECTELLAEKLYDSDSSRAWKWMLIQLFAARGGERHLRIMASALNDEDSGIVLEILKLITDDAGAEGFGVEVRPLFRSKEAAVRRAAVVAFGLLELRDPKARAEILHLATNSDAALRMGAAVSLVELRTPEAIAALHALLHDPEWPVRAEAIAQAARLRDRSTLPLLIERLDAERGRMREDIYGALTAISGEDLGRSSDRWRRWWDAEGETFQVPPPEVLAERQKERAEREAQSGGTRGPSFYGVEVFSERVCFVLDVSGSMRINAGQGVDPEGPQDPDLPSRMDVAKEQLSDIVRAFPDGKLFNLIFFESEVRSLDDRLIKMKKSERQRSLRFIREQYSLGGTALYPAMQLAFADPLVDTIFLISDGAPTEGEITDIEEIRREVERWNSARHVRIHGITIGQDSTLLRWLTEDTGGTYTRRD